MKLAFITGITGQDGSYLVELLLEKNYKVYGIQRRTSLFNTSRIDKIRHNITMKYGDISDSTSLLNYFSNIINENKDFTVLEIYNLAAQSHVKISFEIPEYTTNIDAIGTLKILEIIKSFPENIRNKIKFYQASSSEMYGKVLESPQNEKTPFNPISPYATAKLYAHFITKNYRNAYNLFACNGILFNHESPRRGENFVTMKIINGIKNICNGNKEYIELGNLNSKRDWGHAKDYVYGMWLMLQQDKPDDFVLATGYTYSIKEFIEKAFLYKNIQIIWKGEGLDEVGIDKKTNNIRIKINKKYFRPNEVDYLLGDYTKAKNVLNWEPRFTLEDLIKDMFIN